VLNRLVCLVRGHRWETTVDSVGAITSCVRCKKTRYGGGVGGQAVDAWPIHGAGGTRGDVAVDDFGNTWRRPP
jgi:hypothetical protein